MLKLIVFFLVTGSMIICGLLFGGKYWGYPSALERKNKVLRAVKIGCSNTVLGVGLLLLFLYWESPETFWTQWTSSSIVVGILLAIALFFIMVIGALIQIYSWERTETSMRDRLRKIIDSRDKNGESPK